MLAAIIMLYVICFLIVMSFAVYVSWKKKVDREFSVEISRQFNEMRLSMLTIKTSKMGDEERAALFDTCLSLLQEAIHGYDQRRATGHDTNTTAKPHDRGTSQVHD